MQAFTHTLSLAQAFGQAFLSWDNVQPQRRSHLALAAYFQFKIHHKNEKLLQCLVIHQLTKINLKQMSFFILQHSRLTWCFRTVKLKHMLLHTT